MPPRRIPQQKMAAQATQPPVPDVAANTAGLPQNPRSRFRRGAGRPLARNPAAWHRYRTATQPDPSTHHHDGSENPNNQQQNQFGNDVPTRNPTGQLSPADSKKRAINMLNEGRNTISLIYNMIRLCDLAFLSPERDEDLFQHAKIQFELHQHQLDQLLIDLELLKDYVPQPVNATVELIKIENLKANLSKIQQSSEETLQDNWLTFRHQLQQILEVMPPLAPKQPNYGFPSNFNPSSPPNPEIQVPSPLMSTPTHAEINSSLPKRTISISTVHGNESLIQKIHDIKHRLPLNKRLPHEFDLVGQGAELETGTKGFRTYFYKEGQILIPTFSGEWDSPTTFNEYWDQFTPIHMAPFKQVSMTDKIEALILTTKADAQKFCINYRGATDLEDYLQLINLLFNKYGNPVSERRRLIAKFKDCQPEDTSIMAIVSYIGKVGRTVRLLKRCGQTEEDAYKSVWDDVQRHIPDKLWEDYLDKNDIEDDDPILIEEPKEMFIKLEKFVISRSNSRRAMNNESLYMLKTTFQPEKKKSKFIPKEEESNESSEEDATCLSLQ